MNTTVTVISVTYESGNVLADMLKSVPQGVPVIIVDNNSLNKSFLKEAVDRFGVQLVANAQNIGFGAACNKGAALAKSEFLLFLNPDARLEKDTLDELVKVATHYPKVAGINPRISDAQGKQIFKRSSKLIPRSEKMLRGWPDSDVEIPILSGAALFVRKKCFDTVGGFDESIFLYHEDDDLSLRLKAQCGPLMFARKALVSHAGGSSSPRTAKTARLKAWHMGRSRVYAVRKHSIPFGVSKAVVQAVLGLISPAIAVSKRKRAKNIAFMRGVMSSSFSSRESSGSQSDFRSRQ